MSSFLKSWLQSERKMRTIIIEVAVTLDHLTTTLITFSRNWDHDLHHDF